MLANGATLAPNVEMMNQLDKNRPRQRTNLRLSMNLWTAIDSDRERRAGNVSRNTWINEAILEKLEREGYRVPLQGVNDA